VNAHGVPIFFVTARPQRERAAPITDLTNAKFVGWD
jgi:hypothetical protein